jgi:hypothetical protein
LPVLFDTHVHIYPPLVLEDVISAALFNAKKIDSRVGSEQCPLVLCLTEKKGENLFNEILSQARQKLLGNQVFCEEVFENTVMQLLWQGKDKVFLVAGRQIICREKFEILGLFCAKEILDGLGAEEVISLLKQENAVVVLPWSFGKWWFKRGKIVADIINNVANISIGDICMRPRFCFESKIIKLARKKNVNMLCGSDPLPIAREEALVASYCSFSNESIDSSISLVENLKSSLSKSMPTGKRNSIIKAVVRYLRLKIG